MQVQNVLSNTDATLAVALIPTLEIAEEPSESPVTKDRAYFAKAIQLRWNKARESVLEVGRLIIEARKTLSPEEYANFRKHDLPFDYSVLQKLQNLAASKRINDPTYKDLLPHSWNTLVEIMNLPDGAFQFGIKEGIISEKASWKTIKDLRLKFDKPLEEPVSNPSARATSGPAKDIVAPASFDRANDMPVALYSSTITVKRSEIATGRLLVVVSKEVADTRTKELADLREDLQRVISRYPFIGEVKIESGASA